MFKHPLYEILEVQVEEGVIFKPETGFGTLRWWSNTDKWIGGGSLSEMIKKGEAKILAVKVTSNGTIYRVNDLVISGHQLSVGKPITEFEWCESLAGEENRLWVKVPGYNDMSVANVVCDINQFKHFKQ